MRYLKLFFAVSLPLASSAAMAEIHTYKVPRIGATEERCKEAESWIVDRFAQLAEAAILNHGCEVNPSRTFDLVIEYAKPVAANLVTTFEEFDYVHGLYDSSEECAAHYDEDLATFKNQTGLEPLLAYCYREPLSEDMDNTWTMRIDGFGTPTKSPQHLARDFYHGINGDPSALASHLKETLESYGASGTKVKIKASANRATIHAFYYAEKALPIVHFSEGQFSNLQLCEGYRDQMREVFARAGGQSVVFFCGGSSYASTVSVYTAGIVMQPLATDLTSVKYSTFDACEAKRAVTEAAWRNGLQKNVIGSICSIEDAFTYNYVRMRMFWVD
jgi:hypothetical protein